MTKMVVDIAHSCDIPVEAELGKIPRVDEYSAIIGGDFDYSSPLPEAVQLMVEKLYAQPEMAEEFVQLTGCDSLAVACGSVHGMKSAIQPLNLRHLEKIFARIDIPLVLHGSSGVIKSREDARERGIELKEHEGGIEDALEYGITKINVSTELQLTFINSVKQALDRNPEEKDIRKLFLPAKKAMKERVRSYIRLFRSSGKGATGLESKLTESKIMHSE
jgi:fructose/tagatose bisphosphate aldolase